MLFVIRGEVERRLEEVAASRVLLATLQARDVTLSPEGDQARAGRGETQLLANHALAQCLCLDNT